MNPKILVIGIVFLACIPFASAATIFFDDFSTLVNINLQDNIVNQNDANVGNIGTFQPGTQTDRALTIDATGSGTVKSNDVAANNGIFNVSPDSDSSLNISLDYSFSAPVNATALNVVGIEVNFDFIDFVAFRNGITEDPVFDVTLRDNDGTVSTVDVTQFIQDQIPFGQTNDQVLVIDFALFSTDIDLTALTALEFDLNSGVNDAQDFSFNIIGFQDNPNVPEPSTYFMIALLGLIGFAHRRKQLANKTEQS